MTKGQVGQRPSSIGKAVGATTTIVPFSLISSCLEVRLRRPSARIASAPKKIAKKHHHKSSTQTTLPVMASPGSEAKGKTAASTPDSSTAARCALAEGNDVPATRAVCKVLVELEELVGTADATKETLSQLSRLLYLCDVVTRGVLDRYEAVPGHQEVVEVLGQHLERARGLAVLCQKGRLARFSNSSRKALRNIDACRNNVVAFAKEQEPELAITEEVYVSGSLTCCLRTVCIMPRLLHGCYCGCCTWQAKVWEPAIFCCTTPPAAMCCAMSRHM